MTSSVTPAASRRTGGASFVAAGILASRISGLVRARVFAHYFGLQSDAADAFTAAIRIPNVLQNLFGEGVLSGSFIPVYAGLVARGDRREADRVAGAVAALLTVIVAALVLVGVIAAPLLTRLIAPGFTGEKRDLTIALVRVIFPGAGLLVLSAWCLGVLNSHHRFLLSYASGVVWNAAMIGALVAFGARSTPSDLAVFLAWGSVAGGALQLVVQLPTVWRVAPDCRLAFDVASHHVRGVARKFVPVFISRGVVQVSGYVDSLLASLMGTGAVTGLANAQMIYMLPISLFGMSIAAAELPSMAGAAGIEADGGAALRARLDAGLRRIAFFVVPSAMALFALGDIVAAALFQTGRFEVDDARRVWAILAGASVGLLSQTLGRLYSSAYYALRDTRTPLRCALIRVALSTALGVSTGVVLPRLLGIDPLWGTVGLTASAGVAGWVEMRLLRRQLSARIGAAGAATGHLSKLWTAAALGAGAAWAIKLSAPALHPSLLAVATLGPYGLVYLGSTWALSVPEARRLASGVL